MSLPGPAEAVRILDEGHGRLNQLLDQLSEEEITLSATIGGGDWSAKDLVGHIASWEEIALETLGQWRARERPTIEDVFGQEAVDRLNAEKHRRKAEMPLDEVRRSAGNAHSVLIRELESMDESEWREKAFYEAKRRSTLGALLGSVLGAPQRPFGHAFAHIPDLEEYVAGA